MTDYTPSLNEIRADFITLHTRKFDEYMVGRTLTSEQEFYGAQFDAALAAHDAEVRATLQPAVTAREDLAELPEGTILRDEIGRVFIRTSTKTVYHWRTIWGSGFDLSDDQATTYTPVTVVWSPVHTDGSKG